MDRKRTKSWEWAIIGLLGLVGSTAVVTSSRRIGGTFDEFFYLDAGLERWRTGSNFRLLAAGTMPLPVDVATLPVYVAENWRGRPWSLADEYREVLTIARLPNLGFYWMILLIGWRLARRLGGQNAGIVAAAFLSAEPNLIAHSALATTDVAFTACLLLFAVSFDLGRGKAWHSRVGWPTVACGLAFCAKASALLFIPILIVAITVLPSGRDEISSDTGGTPTWQRLKQRSFWKDASFIYWGGLLVSFLYCGSDWRPHPKFVAAASQLPPGPIRDAITWIADHLRCFNNAGVALWYQISHNLRGHGSYILGEAVRSAVWYHFPVALAIKLAPAIPMTLAFAALVSRRSLWQWPVLTSLLFLLGSLNCRVQIGVRLQMPLIVLLGIAAAVASSRALAALDESQSSRRPGLTAIARVVFSSWILGAIAWLQFTIVHHWPHYLTYVNEFWGGSTEGEKLVSDSNFDWGQGIPDLLDLIESRKLGCVAVWYFGTDPSAQRLPLRLAPLHTTEIRSLSELRHHVPERYLAVGTTILYGSYIQQPKWLLEWLRAQPIAARTRTFLIYDLGDSDLER